MGKYDDIIDFPYEGVPGRQRMSMENRAAQFAPFSALTGLEDAIAETARDTMKQPELTEDYKNELSRKLQIALDSGKRVVVTYFCPDPTKEGGNFKTVRGFIKTMDLEDRLLVLTDGIKIPLKHISAIY